MPTIVQFKSAELVVNMPPSTTTICSIPVTLDNPVADGNLLVVFVDVIVPFGADAANTPSILDSLVNSWTQVQWGDGVIQKPAGGLFSASVTTGGTCTIQFSCHGVNNNPIFNQNLTLDITAVEIVGISPVIHASGLVQRDAGPALTIITLTDSQSMVVDTTFGSTTVQSVSMVADISDIDGDLFIATNTRSISSVVPSVSPFGYFAYGALDNPGFLLSWSGLAIAPLSIDCDDPPEGAMGDAYTHTFPAFGGTPPYTFSITVGSLPPGLALDTATGIVSGVPTLNGTYPFTIQVEDSVEATADVDCSITITGSPLAISCNNPPSGLQGVAYTHTFLASGGVPPYVFFILVGAIPTGLVLDTATGTISGIPISAGIFNFTVQVTDALSATEDVPCSITITNPIPPPPAPPDGLVATSLFWCLISATLTIDMGTT